MSKEESQKRALHTLRHTMGEDILRYMEDPLVFELMVNPDGKLWADTFNQGRIFTGLYINPLISRQIIYQVADITDQVCTESMPMLAAELPDGSRFQGFLPKVAPSPAFIIRKHSTRRLFLEDYVKDSIMTPLQRNVILQAIRDKKNIIAAGGTKSGKTTLLNAIIAEIAKVSPHDRIVMIEDLPELHCTAENVLSLRTTEGVTMDDLLRSTLRATPDRIVVGEVRSGEALALLDAWSTGHRGGCSTVHSNSARQTLLRLQQMIARVSISPQQATIGDAVDMVVYLKRKGTSRIIEEIIAVDAYNESKKEYSIQQIA
ncbi:MAG: P-type conjugative transfer ATPase TrbB [Smithella sp.]